MIFPVNYINGSYNITITDTGIKTRTGDSFDPLFPESIDLKVTDYCNAGCNFCHENSSIKGEHADIYNLIKILEPLPNGIELAIGGGNPLSWPYLDQFLIWAQDKFICNITVNELHLQEHRIYKNRQRLKSLQQNSLIHGIGISPVMNAFEIEKYDDLKTKISHLIIGRFEYYSTSDFIKEISGNCRTHHDYSDDCNNEMGYFDHYLLLGYKFKGRGLNFNKEGILSNIKEFKQKLPRLMFYCIKKGIKLSFDNLAIEQLDLKSMITQEGWDSHYMGNDGQFSMYIDAVKQEYALSSISENRTNWNEISIIKYFNQLKTL